MIFKPLPHQVQAIKFMVSRPCAGLFLDPGLGKTMSAYTAFEVLKEKKYVDRLLVVSKLRPALNVWPQEIMKWRLNLSATVLHGANKNKLIERKKLPDVIIINYDGLKWLLGLGSVKLKKIFGDKCMVVFDESSALKNTNTSRFKIVKQLIEYFPRRYILTGSPAANGLMNLFGQMFVLDKGASLGRYITHFRNKYYNQDPHRMYSYTLKEGADTQIYNAIKPITIRYGSDQLKLPPLVPVTYKIELPKKVMLLYKDMERDLFVQIENDPVIAKNFGVASQKLRQIANGGIYIGDGETRKHKNLHDEKIKIVEEIVEGLEGKPVLIAYEFLHDLERLKKVFPDAPHIGSGVKNVDVILRNWNSGHVPVLLGQPQSMAHGLNMQATSAAVVWHSLSWSFENYDQFIRRIWRQGQKNTVFVYHVVAENTVDEIILDALNRKEKTQSALFEALKNQVGKKNDRF